MTAQILLEDMIFHAYVGCFDEEKIVGNKFIVNLKFHTNIEKVAKSDDIHKAISYQDVYDIISVIMKKKYNLIETLASDIVDAVKNNFPSIQTIEIKLSKCNPPLGGEVKAASVILTK